jgi:hypothetical protein
VVGTDGPFPVRSCPGHSFYAGHLLGSRQALVVRCVLGYIVVGVFDQGGKLLKTFRKELPSSLLFPGHMPGYFDVDEGEFLEYLRKEFGFTPGLIRVREFRLPEEKLAVYRLPDFYQEFLKDPQALAFDDELRQYLPGQIQRWRDEGRFVLQWGNDFWLDSNGEVTDS